MSIVGKITIQGETGPVNVMLLEGELAISTDDCGMGHSILRIVEDMVCSS